MLVGLFVQICCVCCFIIFLIYLSILGSIKVLYI